jgi:hypothetical protein
MMSSEGEEDEALTVAALVVIVEKRRREAWFLAKPVMCIVSGSVWEMN